MKQNSYFTIKRTDDSVIVLDQRLLPNQEVYHTYFTYRDVEYAIIDMVLRGAPLIGIAAAFGIALAAKKSIARKDNEFFTEMRSVCDEFAKTRPTAVNLFWAISRMRKIIDGSNSRDEVVNALSKEADAVFAEDLEINKSIGSNGSRFIHNGDTVLTHCNAGALATAGFGTALGVIRHAVSEGKSIKVFCCETRPYLQGARLTAWELMKDGIDATVICDNMAAHFMKDGKIKSVIVGADRVALNGDVANKIGTYTHAITAKYHGIPFYVASPISTFDVNTPDGSRIAIEERSVDELAFFNGVGIAPIGVKVRNPSFDVTPAGLISAIVTEKGVLENPSANGIASFVR